MRVLLLNVIVLGLVGSAAMAQDRRGIRFWNLTLYTITSLQMSPAGQETWGPDQCQNVEAVSRIPDLKDYGLPILIGTSRKAFLGSLTGDGIEATLIGTVAANLVAAAAGASIFRVHDVAEHVAALRIFHAMHADRGR